MRLTAEYTTSTQWEGKRFACMFIIKETLTSLWIKFIFDLRCKKLFYQGLYKRKFLFTEP
jgi:hypothetical protein